MSLEVIVSYVASFGFGGVVVLVFVWYFIRNPLAMFTIPSQLSSVLVRLRLANHRNVVTKKLEATLNSAVFTLKNETPAVFDKSIRFKWIKDGNGFADVSDGDIVLFIKDNMDTEEIVADATMLYLRNSVALDSRPYVERGLLEAIDVTLAQRILVGYPNAYEHLQRNFVDPLLDITEKNRMYELASTLDEYGVLTRIVLAEYSTLGLRLKGKSSTTRRRNETVNFATFVERVVTREAEDVPLRFRGNLFSSTVALIANPATQSVRGINYYKRKFRHDIESGVRVIHLLARGDNHIGEVRRLARWALRIDLVARVIPRNFAEATSEGRSVRAICISCYSAKLPTILQLTPVDEMYSSLYEILPETLTGELEIVEIAREPNVRSKIVIRSYDGINPISRCVGQDGENVKALKTRLHAENEIVDFILWKPDIVELVKRAMYPLREDEILELDFDESSTVVRISLWSNEFLGRIIGKDGTNVRLAEKVTGCRILFEDKESMLSPKELAARVVARYVKPISEDQVRIVRLVRHPRQLKVLVDSESIQCPAIDCARHADFERIKSMLSGEYVTFVDWDENDCKQIGNALCPLNSADIVECKINEKRKTATVFVLNDKAQQDAVGYGGRNVKAAEALTGFRITVKVYD